MKDNIETQDDEETYLPPRSKVHDSELRKWNLYFYYSLFLLFIGLLVGLLVWGSMKYSFIDGLLKLFGLT
jgi:hypothetical protein